MNNSATRLRRERYITTCYNYDQVKGFFLFCFLIKSDNQPNHRRLTLCQDPAEQQFLGCPAIPSDFYTAQHWCSAWNPQFPTESSTFVSMRLENNQKEDIRSVDNTCSSLHPYWWPLKKSRYKCVASYFSTTVPISIQVLSAASLKAGSGWATLTKSAWKIKKRRRVNNNWVKYIIIKEYILFKRQKCATHQVCNFTQTIRQLVKRLHSLSTWWTGTSFVDQELSVF